MGETLPNAPLKEAMIEIHWELELLEEFGPLDRSFELGVGALWSSIRSEYRRHIRRGVGTVPMPFEAVHRFKTVEDDGPIIQMGPGVMTVSHTNKGYSWKESFLPLFHRMFLELKKSYLLPMRFIRCRLIYVDAVEIGKLGSENSYEFMRDHMNVSVVQDWGSRGRALNATIEQQVSFDEMEFIVKVSSGTIDGAPAVIWTTSCMLETEKKEGLSDQDINEWLEKAHDGQNAILSTISKDSLSDYYRKHTH